MKYLKISTSEIAKICNVSQGTVDRALNNRTDIKAETKQKILEVARQYGYREYVNTRADKIVGQIGVIVFNLNNEYFSELITEVEYALREEGLGATVMMSHFDKEYEIECIRNLYNMGVKGIILCSVNSGAEFENYLKLFDIPIVAVGNRVQSLPYAGIDDFAAMYDMTEKVLKEEEPLNIIYFSPALRYTDAYAQRKRYEGFISAVGNKKYTVVTDIDDIKTSYPEKTAVICSNDYYALRVYFKSPGVKVVGCDNIGDIDKYKISIDSVGYSMTEIARGAIDIINGKRKDSLIVKHYITEHNK
ncbi:MAG: LacI family DNA-binding transcriptional regulator [Clostridia bacterium]|nr:LacI family DNA-binding transcriptional regulator [Clostridia bacterium]